ncbi:helix-turn-helix domain containing protein [Xenophilus arseniciresistens]|uniref:Helix-turn-helix domain containing protein n=1 Tax=Xenophilus arseniciresistens TaxID=1283306 RepID=A0AAE3N3G5_9BURK|nr:TetR/AcrR family transcriptional regulator [Xenophilus arseniciresistens]MDA7414850.1 helix-turn-helix domain containing protein [Xenophilus arseniciresistens]
MSTSPASISSSEPSTPPARTRLLDAALQVIRTKGYHATTVDEICAAAGVTKGSFFHHFKGKEELAVMATHHWNDGTGAFFAGADYHRLPSARERVLAYIELRGQMLEGELADFTCLLGTMVQEAYATHPQIRDACRNGIEGHARTVALDIAEAKAVHAPQADWQPQDLALYTQAVLQGAFVLAKAQGHAEFARRSVDFLRQHVESLLPLRAVRSSTSSSPRNRRAQ